MPPVGLPGRRKQLAGRSRNELGLWVVSLAISLLLGSPCRVCRRLPSTESIGAVHGFAPMLVAPAAEMPRGLGQGRGNQRSRSNRFLPSCRNAECQVDGSLSKDAWGFGWGRLRLEPNGNRFEEGDNLAKEETDFTKEETNFKESGIAAQSGFNGASEGYGCTRRSHAGRTCSIKRADCWRSPRS